MTLLPLVCVLALTGCPKKKPATNDGGPGAGGGAQVARAAGLLTGERAEKVLSPARARLLKRLREQSSSPVAITLDAVTGSVVLMSLDYKPAAVTGTATVRANAFLNDYQALIDPRISVSEYFPAAEPRGCERNAATFERRVGGQVVLGSKLAVYFSPEGHVTGVENSVASVAARVEGRAGGDDRRVLAKLLPLRFDPRSLRPEEVLIPVVAGGDRFLRLARQYVWTSPAVGARPAGLYAAIVDGGGLVGPYLVGDRTRVADPKPLYHLDEQTGIPDFITYRPAGGVRVEKLPGEAAPGEIVYRFLAAHPALFRTGAPRCQYRVASVGELPNLPGVSFVKMQQLYAGLPVFGAELVFELHDLEKVMSVAGHALSGPNLDVEPKLSAGEARRRAQDALRAALAAHADARYAEAVGRELDGGVPKVELGVFPGEIVPTPGRKPPPTRLSYRVTLPGYVYFIDAASGETLYAHSTRPAQLPAIFVVNDAAGQNQFQRPTYVAVNVNGTASSPPGFTPNGDVAGTVTSLGTLRSFYAGLGWNGVDNRGGAFVANTSVAYVTPTPAVPPVASCSPLNAMFDTAQTKEAYFCLGMSVTDVIGHEFTHGVISNSSNFVYRDEGGALHESYADIMGNLAFPDATTPPATVPGWLVGETAASGTLRDMATPGAFGGTVGNMAAYIARNSPGAGCTALPDSCDSGSVHANSGITSLAHVLLSDGIAGVTAGIGRVRLATLAFMTMTQRLTQWSRLVDSAVATHEMCETLRVRGGVAADGTTGFGFADCDQVPLAFRRVGLARDLQAGWAEPEVGFTGTETWFTNAGDVLTSGCNVTGVNEHLTTPSGEMVAAFTPATGTTPAVNTPANYFGQFGVGVVTPPTPGGSPRKLHAVGWFSIWGRKPVYFPSFADAGGGASCITPAGFTPVQRVSASTFHGPPDPLNVVGGSGDESAGPVASSMAAGCQVTGVDVELVDSDSEDAPARVGPAQEAKESVQVGTFLGQPIMSERGARVIQGQTLPVGPPNLSVRVHWWHEAKTDVRYRLRYYINQPTGVTCIPR